MTKKEMKAAVGKLNMLQNSKAALAKTEREIERAEHPLAELDRKIYEIAAKHLIAIEERGDLEARHCDSEDFIEISVWGLEAALKDAYEAGRKSK